MIKGKIMIKAAATVLVASAFLVGCSHTRDYGHHGSSYSSSGWGNYKCVATNKKIGGYRSVGWSTSSSRAKANALDKCRARTRHHDSCFILTCHNS